MDHFHYIDNDYYAEDVKLAEIAASVGTPFYCYSSATLERHYKVFSESFAGLPTRVCYAVKANANLAVLKTLAKLGAGADVVSQGEIRLARAAGIPANKIVFSGVGKTREEMAYGLEQNIFQFNVESEAELLALNEVALGKGMKAPIAFRVNPDVTPGTHAKISTGQKESKFGVAWEDAERIYQLAGTLPGIEVQGVSVHIGSQLTTLEPFGKAFARVRELVERLRAQGLAIRTLDLGGGLGIPYGPEEPPLPGAYADITRQAIAGLDCELIFEPGRLLVGNAGILVTRVIYLKHSAERTFVIVDAGMNDLLRPSLYNAYHEIVPVALDESAPTQAVDVVGPVCETGDIFATQRMLRLPKEGDLLALRSSGAYGAVMTSTYNARLPAPEVLVKGDQFAITRARPSYEEMIAQYHLPKWL